MDEFPPTRRASASAPSAAPVAVDDPRLARSRIEFLTYETTDPGHVRDTILASWRRSRRLLVPADRIDLPYTSEHDLDTPLSHAAEPVLERLGDQLDGQPISLILTDPTGVVLAQRTGDPDLHRHLEGVELAPGFSYGEQFVGTNGIGTALEEGRATQVFGHEHYAEHLENLACAGAPIHHPISGKVIGAVDLTCWRKDAGPLLIALARTTAEQIRQALLIHGNARDLELFKAYLRTCRRTTGIVMAFNDDVVVMNDRARRLLDPADQSVLLGQATQALAEGRGTTETVALPTGGKVRLHFRLIPGRRMGEVTGGVLGVTLIESDEAQPATVVQPVPMFLPGMVGSAPVWLRCCHEVDTGYGRGDWLVLAGERGAGKYAVARCVHQRRNPTGRARVLDAADPVGAGWIEELRRDLLADPVDALVIRHVDRLTEQGATAVAGVLREVRARRDVRVPWVAVTLTEDAETGAELADVLAWFPRTVAVPPLRRHVEDLNELVPLFLSKIGHGRQLTCSPAAMHLLMRADWPGNIGELYHVLRRTAQHRRTGAIQPTDLPAEYRAVTRRPLNRLESMERDVIVHSLEDANGNKRRAAQLLGMSRATLYRKIHEYGIVTLDR